MAQVADRRLSVLKDREKTKEPLLNELEGLRRRVAELERSETACKRAEQKQERMANGIRLFLELTDVGIIGVDREGRCTFINQAGAEILGYRTEEILGQTIHRLIHHSLADGSDYPEEECPMYYTLLEGGMFHWDHDAMWRKDGTYFWADYLSFPISKGGSVKGAVIVFMDITDRKNGKEIEYQNNRT
jgi:PAS domain S-box-containing protein